MTEIWYTPHDGNRIEEIFEAMKHCQSLHPDPNGMYNTFNDVQSSCNKMSHLAFVDDFSDEEEDEFIMAEDNNHAAEDDIDQEDMRNLHIDGKYIATQKQFRSHIKNQKLNGKHFRF